MKIAFIAMSGVRAHNEELTRLGSGTDTLIFSAAPA